MPHFGDPGHLTPHEAQRRSAQAKRDKRELFDRINEILQNDDEEFEEVAQAFLLGLKERVSPLWAQWLDRTMGPVKQLHDHMGHQTPDTQITIGPAHAQPPKPLPFDEKQQAPEALPEPKETRENGKQD